MSCLVPLEYQHLRWHVICPMRLTDAGWVSQRNHFEIAAWERNASGYGVWTRWGYCGDFESLCRADYVGPFPDQGMLERVEGTDANPG